MSRLNLELPRISSLDELVLSLNDRLRRVAEEFSKPTSVTTDADLVMGGHRVTSLGNPRTGTDALSLAYADSRYLKRGEIPQVAAQVVSTSVSYSDIVQVEHA